MLPDPTESTFQPWESASEDAIQAVREIATNSQYWEDLSTYYAEENHETTIIQDNVSCVKSICRRSALYYVASYSSFRQRAVQLLEDEPFEAFHPIVDRLISDKDPDKQRAAAEFLAGILGGAYLYAKSFSFFK